MAGFEPYFQELPGLWALERSSSDGSHFCGEAEFHFVSEDQLRMVETGTLKFRDGREFSANRSWLWTLTGDEQLEVHFDEAPPRLYHSINLKLDDVWLGEASHLCGNDIYVGRYRFSQKQFEIVQAITGPNKNYQIKSTYSA